MIVDPVDILVRFSSLDLPCQEGLASVAKGLLIFLEINSSFIGGERFLRKGVSCHYLPLYIQRTH